MPLLQPQLDIPRCPHCNVDRPSLHQAYILQTKDYAGENQRVWGIYSCSRCGGVVTAWARQQRQVVAEIFPSPSTVDEALPPKERSYLEQALNSLHAPAGAIMLAASSVDAMLKAKGLKEGSLYRRIDQAAADHLITQEMARWAHEVRLDANDERHADDDAPLPTQADAKKCVDFVLALGQFLFVLPARVERGIAEAKSS